MADNVISIDELFRQKGELVTQIEIAQTALARVNGQLQLYFNQQPPQQAPGQPQLVK